MELKNSFREVAREKDGEGHGVWLVNGMIEREILEEFCIFDHDIPWCIMGWDAGVQERKRTSK